LLKHNRIMDNQPIIRRDPAVMLGKPTITGTRITVELIMRKLSGGFTVDDILDMYPHLNRKQITAALDYAANLIAHEVVIDK